MYWFHIAFVYDRMCLLFAPKLPFLGLIITAGTFQYRVWSDLADRGKRRITDPQWLELGRRVQERRRRLDANIEATRRGIAATALSPTELFEVEELERTVKTWKK
jgi:hypothetical protein